MTLQVLEELKRIGVEVIPQGDNLVVRPASKVPPELKQRLKTNKAAVLAALRACRATKPTKSLECRYDWPPGYLDFGEPRQNGFDYPVPLTEKYQPRRIEEFIGLEGPKRLFGNLLKAPRPVAILLVGPPGCGKTTLAMAFAEELPGTLHHVSSQKCDVAALDRLNETLAYYPPRGRFHVVKVDEADQMTEKAQLQLLSRLDGTASLKPRFGGGFERGPVPPVIWIFTCNGRGENGTIPPSTFEPRFRSRCLVVACEKPEVAHIAQFLRRIWLLESGDPSADPSPIAEGCDGVRDALNKLEVALSTGIVPSKLVESKPGSANPKCGVSGRVCYRTAGQPARTWPE